MQEPEGCWLHLLRVESPGSHVGPCQFQRALVRAGTLVQSRELAVHHHAVRLEGSRRGLASRQSCPLERRQRSDSARQQIGA